MNTPIRIGTRDSKLALWQANLVKDSLEELGVETVLVPIKSIGDLILDKPLYELGVTGVFTKALDVALLNGDIDLAVHSMKDMPTMLPKGLALAAVLKRGNPKDVLVHKGLDFLNESGLVATGSLRRQAQWLHRYPSHEITDLRGNVQTRLQKLRDNKWDGALFAAAGLERLSLEFEHQTVLEWMIPAPAQGAIAIVITEEDKALAATLEKINHRETAICTRVEREFLRTLEGGCSAPIGALATIEGETLRFKGVLLSPDGQQRFHVSQESPRSTHMGVGKEYAQQLLKQGADKLMQQIKIQLGKS